MRERNSASISFAEHPAETYIINNNHDPHGNARSKSRHILSLQASAVKAALQDPHTSQSPHRAASATSLQGGFRASSRIERSRSSVSKPRLSVWASASSKLLDSRKKSSSSLRRVSRGASRSSRLSDFDPTKPATSKEILQLSSDAAEFYALKRLYIQNQVRVEFLSLKWREALERLSAAESLREQEVLDPTSKTVLHESDMHNVTCIGTTISGASADAAFQKSLRGEGVDEQNKSKLKTITALLFGSNILDHIHHDPRTSGRASIVPYMNKDMQEEVCKHLGMKIGGQDYSSLGDTPVKQLDALIKMHCKKFAWNQEAPQEPKPRRKSSIRRKSVKAHDPALEENSSATPTTISETITSSPAFLLNLLYPTVARRNSRVASAQGKATSRPHSSPACCSGMMPPPPAAPRDNSISGLTAPADLGDLRAPVGVHEVASQSFLMFKYGAKAPGRSPHSASSSAPSSPRTSHSNLHSRLGDPHAHTNVARSADFATPGGSRTHSASALWPGSRRPASSGKAASTLVVSGGWRPSSAGQDSFGRLTPSTGLMHTSSSLREPSGSLYNEYGGLSRPMSPLAGAGHAGGREDVGGRRWTQATPQPPARIGAGRHAGAGSVSFDQDVGGGNQDQSDVVYYPLPAHRGNRAWGRSPERCRKQYLSNAGEKARHAWAKLPEKTQHVAQHEHFY